MSLTRELVRLIRRKTASEADLAKASHFVLDTLACALAARGTAPARMLTAVAPSDCSDPARRAFLLGGLSHIIEMDDLHRNSVTHPGCIVIPAAWAVAEAEGVGGRAFLRATLDGYEAMCRVGMAVGRAHYRVWHNTSTCGPFGSAMAVASLLKLDEDQTVWALGNAGTQSAGLWEFLASGGMSKHLHTARGAEAGVLAALLAREGFTGPDRILEGEKGLFAGACPDPDPTAVTADPDGPWQLTRTSIKPWPCCRHVHPAIDAAISLHRDLGSAPVEAVHVGAYRAALDVCDRPRPEDAYGAKFSLQHAVAVALIDGKVTEASFDADARGRVASLRDRVSIEFAAAIDAAYPRHWGVTVSVETMDGRRLTASRRDAKGDPETPVTTAELTDKARMLLTAGGISGAGADRFLGAVLGLIEDRPVSELQLLASYA